MHYKTLPFVGIIAILFSSCQQQPPRNVAAATTEAPKEKFELLGYESKAAWGEHLVMIAGCEDCHSPKKITEKGPIFDPELRLSGHHASFVPLNVNRKEIEQNGFAACNTHMTAWAGPWGMSFTGNLTSHATGIGNWTEENFKTALRKGKLKGQENGRNLLPPMPWFNYSHMTDDELSAIFAYLKTVPPVENVVPPPLPPLSASVN